MSKIKELLRNKDTILVFDIDGVLAILEFGEYTHFALDDAEWARMCEEGMNFYTEDKVCKKIQNFLKDRKMENVYVITKAYNANEGEAKRDYANRYYNIPSENLYYVEHNSDKVKILNLIKGKYPQLQDRQIVMIDDTVEVLNDVMKNTSFSTAHVSSFLDI